LETLICCNVALNRPDEARRCAARRGESEKPAGDIFAPLWRLNPAWHRQVSDALLSVGIHD
jgi:hypothetical protein